MCDGNMIWDVLTRKIAKLLSRKQKLFEMGCFCGAATNIKSQLFGLIFHPISHALHDYHHSGNLRVPQLPSRTISGYSTVLELKGKGTLFCPQKEMRSPHRKKHRKEHQPVIAEEFTQTRNTENKYKSHTQRAFEKKFMCFWLLIPKLYLSCPQKTHPPKWNYQNFPSLGLYSLFIQHSLFFFFLQKKNSISNFGWREHLCHVLVWSSFNPLNKVDPPAIM